MKTRRSEESFIPENVTWNDSLLTNWLALFKKLLAETDATPRNTQYPNIKDTKTSTLSTIFTLLAVTLKDLFFYLNGKLSDLSD